MSPGPVIARCDALLHARGYRNCGMAMPHGVGYFDP